MAGLFDIMAGLFDTSSYVCFMPDSLLMHIFGYLSPKDLCLCERLSCYPVFLLKDDSHQTGLSKNRREDGTTTGQDEASLPQLAAISFRRRVDGTA